MTEEKPATEDPLDDSAEMPEEDVGPKYTNLPSSEPLNTDSACAVMGSAVTRLVVLGGPQDSGKTTLASSIYEQFQRGPFAGFSLGWTDTLMGFERVCHESRDASGLETPNTLHTSRQVGRQLFHFRLWNESSDSDHPLLITDISGEEFEDLHGYDDVCSKLTLLRRADHFAVLIAGDRVVDPAERHRAFDETTTIIRTLIENDLLSTSTHLEIVISKCDRIRDAESGLNVDEYLDSLESRLRSKFADKVGSIEFFKTIARDKDAQKPLTDGVDSLLEHWVRFRRITKFAGSNEDLPKPVRPFDCFKGRLGRR